jgi:PAS domain S-box-containing protein
MSLERALEPHDAAESEARYRALVESINDAILSLDAGGKVTYVSPVIRNVGGWMPEQWLGQPFTNFVHSDDLSTVRTGVEGILAGQPGQIQFRLLDNTGVFRHVRLSARPIVQDGRVVGLAGILSALTERKGAEQKAARRQNHYRALVEASNDAIFVHELLPGLTPGFIVKVNDVAVKRMGYSAAEFAALTPADLDAPELAGGHRHAFEKLCAEGHVTLETIHVAKDGRRIPVEVSARLAEIDGKTFSVAFARDITERKRAEEALRNSEAKYRRIVDTANEGIWVSEGADLLATFVNARMAEMLGYPQEEMLGRPYTDFMFEEDIPDHQQRINNRRRAISEHYERRFRRKDGQTVWFHVSAVPILDEHHSFQGSFAMYTDITERKRAEEALRNSEARYRRIVDTASEGIWVVGGNLLTTFVNTRMAALLGCRPEEMLGRPHSDFMFEEDIPDYLQRMKNRRRGTSERYERRFRRKDGQTVWVLISAVPVLDEQGRFEGAFAMHTDITERKQMEEAIRVSERRHRALFESAPDSIFLMRDGVFIECNEMALQMYGCTREQIIGHSPIELSPPQQPDGRSSTEAALEKIQRALNSEETVRFEWLHWRADHTPFDAEVTLKRFDLAGEAHLASIVKDVSQRKNAERALRLSEERAQLGAQAAKIGYFDHDHITDEIYLSPWTREILGYGPDETLTLQKYVAMVHPEDRAQVAAEIERSHDPAGDGLLDKEYRLVLRDSRIRWIAMRTRTLFEGEGAARHNVRTVGALLDITERKRLEAQYEQAQKMEAVGRLAGGIAHDFNNILGLILGSSELAQDRVEPDHPVASNIAQIKQAAERAAGLTKKLLAFSRQQVIYPVVLDLNKVVRNALEMLKPLLGEDVRLVFQAKEGLGLVRADPGQIDQILMNLGVNARDAMPSGGRIVIATHNVDLDEKYGQQHGVVVPGPYVMLSMGDTGEGIAPHDLPRIFEPFFTTKEPGKGTGLGLATVYGIVRQSNGYIWVYSEPGTGTTFKIYFPRVQDVEHVPEPESEGKVQGGTETILLVEDESGLRDVAVNLLESSGYTVLQAENASQALILAQNYTLPIELLLTDVIMPNMSGIELCAHLRKIRPDIKLLYMSGYAGQQLGHYGKFEQEIEFLEKPFTRNSLLKKVRAVLDS